jgi:hypothetical protein
MSDNEIFDAPAPKTKKQKMSEERKQMLLENLRRGREKMKAQREARKNAKKEMTHDNNIKIPTDDKPPTQTPYPTTPLQQNIPSNPTQIKDELAELRKELKELKDIHEKKEMRRQIKELRDAMKKEEERQQQKQTETKSAPQEPKPQPPPDTPKPVLQQPQVKPKIIQPPPVAVKSLFRKAMW